MEAVFLKVLNMSVTASYVIAVVLLLRLLLRKLPKKISYLLWSVVAFRLCCPVTWQSVFSLFRLNPLTADSVQVTAGGASRLEYFPSGTGTVTPPQISAGSSAAPVRDAVRDTLPVAPAANADPLQIGLTIAAVFWCAGMAALLIYSIVRYGKMCRQMRTAVLLRENIYQSDRIRSPFILGLVHPKIYIPFGLDEDTMRYVLEHERYHIKRRDYLAKPFAFLLLTIHWFNPLCWLAFHLMGKDMEMSCDETVIGREGNHIKAYSATLLSFAVKPRFPAPSPLAFGETSVKSRIQNVLRWKKPKTWATLLAVLLCILVVVACAANPAHSADPENTVQTGQSVGIHHMAENGESNGTNHSESGASALAYSGPALPDAAAVTRITVTDCYGGKTELRSRVDEVSLEIVDPSIISQILQTIQSVHWDPKEEENWPKFGVDHPTFILAIQYGDRSVQMNLISEKYISVLADDQWQRYEVSTADYNKLAGYCTYNMEQNSFGYITMGDTLMPNAAPETSALSLYVYDGADVTKKYLYDRAAEEEILNSISSVSITEAADWSPDQITLPVYGLEIGGTDGWIVQGAWSNGYWIAQDGTAYRFDYDFEALETDYSWTDRRTWPAATEILPCARFLCQRGDRWYPAMLSPAGELSPPENITAELVAQSDSKLTVELSNHGIAQWTYGAPYGILVLLDEVWYVVPTMPGTFAFPSVAYTLSAGETREKTYSFGGPSYGTLPSGSYRLVTNGLIVPFTIA